MTYQKPQGNAQGRIFNECFLSIHKLVPFESGWANNPNYFGNIVEFNLPAGEMVKSMTDNGRRIILIGTRFGTVAVFDARSGQIDGGEYCIDRPRSICLDYLIGKKKIVGQGSMAHILGAWGNYGKNIGRQLELIAEELAG